MTAIVLAMLWTAAIVYGAEPLGHFDAGRTITLHVGESFTIVLERGAQEPVRWLWPHLPEHLVAHKAAGSRVDEQTATIRETHVFTALTPGTAVVFAEKVADDDPTEVKARYIVTVQVVP